MSDESINHEPEPEPEQIEVEVPYHWEGMSDGEIRTHLKDVADRIHAQGLGAQPPSSEEQMALFLAVNQLFDNWYNEFYLS